MFSACEPRVLVVTRRHARLHEHTRLMTQARHNIYAQQTISTSPRAAAARPGAIDYRRRARATPTLFYSFIPSLLIVPIRTLPFATQ